MITGVVRISDAKIVRQWSGYPKSITLPNKKRIVSPVGPEHLGRELDGFRFVEIEYVNKDSPGEWYVLTKESPTLTATKLTITRTWTRRPQSEIDAEIDAARTVAIDEFLTGGIARMIFEVAKRPEQADMTPAQFATFVRNNWPS